MTKSLFGALAPYQQLARDVYRELIEINTADSMGSVTRAAEAVAGRFRAAGFPDEDVMLLVPDGRPTKGNLVVRYRGRGDGKPILLLVGRGRSTSMSTMSTP